MGAGIFDADSFDEVLIAPRVRRAASSLADTRFAQLLSPECQAQLLDGLSQNLRAHVRDVIETLVRAILAERNPLWGLDARLAPAAEVATARAEVAAKLEASGEAMLDQTAPLLRPTLDRQVERFVTVTRETCARIWNDRHEIAATLLPGSHGGIGMVTRIDQGLADCHDGGRRTCIVTSEKGRFVYKPHDCQIDQWFARVAQEFAPRVLRQPRVIVRRDATGAWGFEEFIAAEPVADEAGIARYWHNMGRALALFQALGSEDLHCENFVACGEHPSLVDMETVLTNDLAYIGDPKTNPNPGFASQGFGRDLDGTPIKSGILPSPVSNAGNADDTTNASNTSPFLAHGLACLPRWQGEEHDVRGYEDELLAGLDEGLSELATKARALSRAVQEASGVPIRRLIRGTSVYARLLARLQKTDAYRQDKRESLLAALHRPLVRGLKTTVSPLAASEIACLLEGDIPYFYAQADSHTITGSDGTADDRLLAASAIERAQAHIAALDEPHRAFVHAVTEANVRRALLPSDAEAPACRLCDEPLSGSDALGEAEQVFRKLDELVLRSPSGEESWLFRDPATGLLAHSDVTLSEGLSGVALFLAALAPRTADPQVRERALVLLDGCFHRIDEVISCLETARIVPESSFPLGLANGFGGVVSALDFAVHALGPDASCEAPRTRARRLLMRMLAVVERADIENARHVDVYAGSAGLLLALSRCSQARESAASRTVAARLVRHLLAARTLKAHDGTPLWDTAGTGWPLSGFGHGQAGVGAALAAAEEAFGLDGGTCACDVLSWELSAYREGLGTWPDFRRSPVVDRAMHGICSGAPGIGLAAQAVGAATRDGHMRELCDDIVARADAACATRGPSYRDTLCCGNLAVCEYLVSRGNRRDAGRLLAGVVERAHARGSYVFLHKGWRPVEDPDLFNGLAGVGYGLLRYADPSLPSVFV